MVFGTDETNIQITETESTNHPEHSCHCVEKSCSNEPGRFGKIKIGCLEMYVGVCDKHAVMLDTRTALRKQVVDTGLDMGSIDEHWDREQGKFIIPCKDDDGVHFIFYCIWCGTEHKHGRGEGHRGAHCTSGSPYSKNGYYLVRESEDRPFVGSPIQ